VSSVDRGGQRDAVGALPELQNRFFTIFHRNRRVSSAFENPRRHFAHRDLILGDQDHVGFFGLDCDRRGPGGLVAFACLRGSQRDPEIESRAQA
jgi:hypothetical protein